MNPFRFRSEAGESLQRVARYADISHLSFGDQLVKCGQSSHDLRLRHKLGVVAEDNVKVCRFEIGQRSVDRFPNPLRRVIELIRRQAATFGHNEIILSLELLCDLGLGESVSENAFGVAIVRRGVESSEAKLECFLDNLSGWKTGWIRVQLVAEASTTEYYLGKNVMERWTW